MLTIYDKILLRIEMINLKKNILFIVASLILMIVLTLYLNNDVENTIYESKTTKLSTSDTLAMMYETEAGSGEYQIANDNTWPQEGYVFNAELSKCENGSTLYWDDETKSVMMEANVSDKCYVYFDINIALADLCSKISFAECITTQLYTGVDGENNLYYHDGQGSYTNSDQEAGDNSYRYSGANPNNYVCFGSDGDTCPNDNLYRIIGVFDGQVKLIKHDYSTADLLGRNGSFITTYLESGWDSNYYRGNNDLNSIAMFYWNSDFSNSWSESDLNTINLNQNYINNLGSTWANKIANHTWQVGGVSSSYVTDSQVKTTYNYELENSSLQYDAKIGLIYVSDYGYATSPENWKITLNSYDNDLIKNNNWMYMGLYDWTITSRLDYENTAFVINDTGRISSAFVSNYSANFLEIRPTFYLESSIVLKDGSGTQLDPYRIA